MKIFVAQTRPFKAEVQKNIDNHLALVALAVSYGADIIIFPELSLTGYEPGLSGELATSADDSRLDRLQEISNSKNVIIGAGMPTRSVSGVQISMVIFNPGSPRQTYSKQYLHSDEYPYFTAGHEQVFLNADGKKIGLAICYELSVPEHAHNVFKNGAQVYIASVAKNAAGVDRAIESLLALAKAYSVTVLMVNCVGLCDGVECAGRSSVWNDKGVLLEQLDEQREGLLGIDTDTNETIKDITDGTWLNRATE